ncbi:unnamed protein product, partial [Gulo gulo]
MVPWLAGAYGRKPPAIKWALGALGVTEPSWAHHSPGSGTERLAGWSNRAPQQGGRQRLWPEATWAAVTTCPAGPCLLSPGTGDRGVGLTSAAAMASSFPRLQRPDPSSLWPEKPRSPSQRRL